MEDATALGEVDVESLALAFALGGHVHSPAFASAGHDDGHGDAHGRAVGAVHPRVVGNGEVEMQPGVERALDDAAVEGLAQAPLRDELCCVVPPEHDKVG